MFIKKGKDEQRKLDAQTHSYSDRIRKSCPRERSYPHGCSTMQIEEPKMKTQPAGTQNLLIRHGCVGDRVSIQTAPGFQSKPDDL